MLHKSPKIISAVTFRLIQQLQILPELKNFVLVGGTSLALQMGHRNSIDIDLFTQEEFEDGFIVDLIAQSFSFREIYRRKNTVIGMINDVKVDFIKHPYPYVNPPITEEGITFLSKEDIAAMKLNAIIQSGQRLKDFIDIYYLLEHFSMQNMLEFFTIKYPHANPLIALKAVNFFDDLDETVDPPKLLKPVSINQIRKRIQDATLHSKKIFSAEVSRF